MVKVFKETNTLWENYAPEYVMKGAALEDFVGRTGLAPISIMLENVFGIQPMPLENKIVWHINCLERHGVQQYPFGDALVDLECPERLSEYEEPYIKVKSTKHLTVDVVWRGKVKTIVV